MKAPANPKTPLRVRRQCRYDDYVKTLGPAPRGWRYLKVGELHDPATDLGLCEGKKWGKIVSVQITQNHWPVIRPLPKKAPNDRWKRKLEDEKLKKVELVDLNDLGLVIEGRFGKLNLSFLWGSTEQGFDYWAKRHHGDAPLSADDLDYLKRLYVAHGGKLEDLKEKFDRAALESVVKAYEALGKEIEALRAALK